MVHKTKQDPDSLRRFRRQLHEHPELADSEADTAVRVCAWLEASKPDEIITGLGGHGLAAVFAGTETGDTVLVRADLDALPIPDRSGAKWQSQNRGVSHACGHDGHMTMVAALAPGLADRRPRRGRVVLLFQPAEEVGIGAKRVVDDPAFDRIRPDKVFALHNLPGHPLGRVLVRPGTFAMGSVGMVVRLLGRTSHAAYPEHGRSPAAAMTAVIRELESLGTERRPGEPRRMATVVHARLGEVSFGTTPGEAVVMATLRSDTEDGLEQLRKTAMGCVRGVATSNALDIEIEWRDPFPVTVNDRECVELIDQVARSQGLEVETMEEPIRWSEDFGWFLKGASGALFGLGAGTDHPPLHAPEYDFPDELIEVGLRLWRGLLDRVTDSRLHEKTDRG